jgi:uncharacterized protein YdaU (DUF1376 family)
MHYYQFNIGDYASHTRYLTPLQDLAYRRLLDLYYLHEKPIPQENPASYIGLNDCSTDVQRVLNDYFILTEKGWINKRADEQIAEYRNKQKSASMAGKKSAEVRKASKDAVLERPLNERTTTVQLTNNHKPITINQEPIKESATKVAKSTRLSIDWELPDEWAIWAKKERPDLNVNQVSDGFKDYWISEAKAKADWFATWRNWIRKQRAERKDSEKPWVKENREWFDQAAGRTPTFEKDIFEMEINVPRIAK